MDTTTIKQKVVVSASPELVYETYMNAKSHSEFTGSKATCVAKEGGKFTAWDGYISGKNLELEKGKRIVQEWITTEWPQNYPPSKLELTLTKVKNGTAIILVHSNVPKKQAAEIAEGWEEFYWKPLKDYFTKKES